MDRAVAFYRDLLQFRVESSDPYWTALSLGNWRVGLHGNGEQKVPTVPMDAHGANAGATLTLETDAIDLDHARLSAAGVRFLGGISRNPWGDLVAFLDSEGNVLKLMQPPR